MMILGILGHTVGDFIGLVYIRCKEEEPGHGGPIRSSGGRVCRV